MSKSLYLFTSPKKSGDFFTVKLNLGKMHIMHLLREAITKNEEIPNKII